MALSIHIYYSKKNHGELVICCYHNNLQAYTKAITLTRDRKIKDNNLNTNLPDSYDFETVKLEVLRLLAQIKEKEFDFNTVTFAADFNLCCNKKEELAPFLFDRTLNNFFDGKEVNLILESSEPLYILYAIEQAEKMVEEGKDLSGIILKTKDSERTSPVYKEFPKNTEAINLSVPKPSMTGLASPKVAIKNQKELTEAMSKIGLFPQENESGARSCGEKAKTAATSPPSTP
ncbi:hypothetical protein [Legionella maceachernii]|uniref:Uncharacterized protein n=1 Tax=Legionella maceachernii TaxID=466 RepID=A0A0W0WAP5_9GAMM|nr:hypothetical protein [Legionella maceachernii]KTD29420.1 hypothetical protein Lmac_0930 [Legionella maceachernii]SJZ95272.1 hypothetical protein SAMN02745128_01570 [Legionella maceachernii]SUP03304.1 Uncharacterised protein [Legionella maceachernii]